MITSSSSPASTFFCSFEEPKLLKSNSACKLLSFISSSFASSLFSFSKVRGFAKSFIGKSSWGMSGSEVELVFVESLFVSVRVGSSLITALSPACASSSVVAIGFSCFCFSSWVCSFSLSNSSLSTSFINESERCNINIIAFSNFFSSSNLTSFSWTSPSTLSLSSFTYT
ncbi:hypothetical protein WICPIJ_004653 [Wickerhamomyces pijperi]|uniref:Uncharacterized protein n=1 Tax=Wickerhamomyces pijperi TaxID=599730 RepID=A0A9P8Q501_WICPI|nr:hypothetical protein WICPIJ_004653 [Wickerhamomyces pijperi]